MLFFSLILLEKIESSVPLKDEENLFFQLARGDESAFARIYHHYVEKLFPFVYKLAKSETVAEDVVQSIFLKLWQNREELIQVKNYKAYIFTMATNATLNYLKRMATEARICREMAKVTQSSSNETEERLRVEEIRSMLDLAIDQMPPQRKLIYQLSREQGFKNEEIAKKTNLSSNTVRNHLAEALRSLRKLIYGKNFG